MEIALFDFLRQIGNQWLALGFIAFWGIYKSGLVQSAFGIKSSERAQLSKDQQNLVDNLRRALGRLERRLDNERDECARQRAELRAECDRELAEMHEQIATLVKGEQRWRHLVSNLAVYIDVLRNELSKAGVEVPRFQGWAEFIASGGDPLVKFGGE